MALAFGTISPTFGAHAKGNPSSTKENTSAKYIFALAVGFEFKTEYLLSSTIDLLFQ
jgi:hypothetical protein